MVDTGGPDTESHGSARPGSGYARPSSSPQAGDARGPAPSRRAANSRRALSSDRANVPDRLAELADRDTLSLTLT
jgi:hypothetical protein